ncbi:MAG TPA: GNAT family N-acetyltransferase, partial [Acidimicrobiales bacterium]|nr:GNAT family N-acetyltransferase [Acidimicrobiales bacterium]
MVRARLGVVLLLPSPVAAEVDGLRRAVGDRSVGDVPPHITLVPPVNVAGRERDAALAPLRDAAAASPPLRVVLAAAATFWPATPVVYLPVHGDADGVQRLHDALATGPWVRPTTWPFVPHVTIAQDVAPEIIPAAVRVLAAYRGEATLTSVSVLREQLDGSWTVLADAALSGRHVVGRGGLEVVLDEGAALDEEARRRLAAVLRPRPAPFALSARREGAVVGAASGATADVLCLDQLVVDPAVRGQGVGHHLLRAVEALGAARGCASAVALVPAGSPAEAWLSS